MDLLLLVEGCGKFGLSSQVRPRQDPLRLFERAVWE